MAEVWKSSRWGRRVPSTGRWHPLPEISMCGNVTGTPVAAAGFTCLLWEVKVSHVLHSQTAAPVHPLVQMVLRPVLATLRASEHQPSNKAHKGWKPWPGIFECICTYSFENSSGRSTERLSTFTSPLELSWFPLPIYYSHCLLHLLVPSPFPWILRAIAHFSWLSVMPKVPQQSCSLLFDIKQQKLNDRISKWLKKIPACSYIWNYSFISLCPPVKEVCKSNVYRRMNIRIPVEFILRNFREDSLSALLLFHWSDTIHRVTAIKILMHVSWRSFINGAQNL